jgi:RNA polymerase sigma factor (sigma-70 family)
MSQRDDRNLLHRAQQGDRSARERLVVQHLDDVRSIAGRYRNLGLGVDDLVQEGSLGLLDAIDHYDETRGLAFDVYARFRIRRAVRSALTDTSRLIACRSS